jgi:deazaflavin-dependent oxidoreductase (nitroreductase family)
MTAERIDFLYLTTRGRRTGQPREIEIWFTDRAGRQYVIAEHGERAQWVQNIRADVRVNWRVGERAFRGRARVVDPVAESALVLDVKALSAFKYGWSDGLVVELAPDPGGAAPHPSPDGGPS